MNTPIPEYLDGGRALAGLTKELREITTDMLNALAGRLKWGTYGASGLESLKVKILNDLDTNHLENILITQLNPIMDSDMLMLYRRVILHILKKRYTAEATNKALHDATNIVKAWGPLPKESDNVVMARTLVTILRRLQPEDDADRTFRFVRNTNVLIYFVNARMRLKYRFEGGFTLPRCLYSQGRDQDVGMSFSEMIIHFRDSA